MTGRNALMMGAWYDSKDGMRAWCEAAVMDRLRGAGAPAIVAASLDHPGRVTVWPNLGHFQDAVAALVPDLAFGVKAGAQSFTVEIPGVRW